MTLKKINFFAQNVSLPVKKKKLIRAWLLLLMQTEVEFLSSAEINLVFCDDEYLYQLNTQYLKHNTLTDIITFDYSENNHLKADVFISTERVKENAKLFQQTFTDEISRVMAHGILHVCGYKDKTVKAKAIMTEKENYYLDVLNDLTNQSNA